MQLSSLPAKIAAIFAASAAPTSKNTIPLTQAGILQPGQASFDVGFPAVTMQPAASGGLNPYGQDFNGILNAVTAVEMWQSAGGFFPYDATFASSVGGYPKGSILSRVAGTGFWLCTTDNNSTNPETGGAGWITFAADWTTGVDTGAANAALVNYTPVVTTLVDGMVLWFKAAAANTGATTLNVNGLGARPVVGGAHAALQGGEIIAAGKCQVVYNATLSSFVLIECTGGALQVAPGSQSSHASQMAQVAGVVGSVRNLRAFVAAASATAAFTADEIIVESALGGVRYCLPNFNKTINLGTNGAGGMDAGTAPVSGWVGIYAIWNPTTSTSAVLATNATSAIQPSVYGGANMPAGYTASGLISVWPTTAGSLLAIASQFDRDVHFYNSAYSGGGGTGSYVSLSLAASVPKNAYRWRGNLTITQTATAGNCSAAVCPTGGGSATPGYVAVQTYSAASGISGGTVPDCPIFTAQTTYWVASGQGGTPTAFNINSYGYSF